MTAHRFNMHGEAHGMPRLLRDLKHNPATVLARCRALSDRLTAAALEALARIEELEQLQTEGD